MNKILCATEFIKPSEVAKECKRMVKAVEHVNKLPQTSKYNSLSDIMGEVVDEVALPSTKKVQKQSIISRIKNFFGARKKINSETLLKEEQSLLNKVRVQEEALFSLEREISSTKTQMTILQKEQTDLLKVATKFETDAETIARENLKLKYGKDVVEEYIQVKKNVSTFKQDLKQCGLGDSFKEDSWVISNHHADKELWRTREALWTQESKLQQLEKSYYQEYLNEIYSVKQNAKIRKIEANEIGKRIKELENVITKTEKKAMQIRQTIEADKMEAAELYKQRLS